MSIAASVVLNPSVMVPASFVQVAKEKYRPFSNDGADLVAKTIA